MEWINIKDKQPEIGLEVKVKTIYEFEDTGIWDGTKWLNSAGEFKGEADEAPQWKLTTSA
jgi:hypothetical protein